MEWAARAIGLFYLLGGLFAVRSFAVELLVDRALVAVDSRASVVAERVATWLLLIGAVLTAFSGLALLLLSAAAPLLFGANLLWQTGYLLWARRWRPAEDADATLGRKRATNAAAIWTIMTVLVVWLSSAGAFE